MAKLSDKDRYEYKVLPISWSSYPELERATRAIDREGYEILFALITRFIEDEERNITDFFCKREKEDNGEIKLGI